MHTNRINFQRKEFSSQGDDFVTYSDKTKQNFVFDFSEMVRRVKIVLKTLFHSQQDGGIDQAGVLQVLRVVGQLLVRERCQK